MFQRHIEGVVELQVQLLYGGGGGDSRLALPGHRLPRPAQHSPPPGHLPLGESLILIYLTVRKIDKVWFIDEWIFQE